MIEVNDLKFRYPGNEKDTLLGLDFEIKEGEIFGFLGPNGAGKSTTQRILTGILKKYQGQVKVFGNELKESKRDIYNKIGVGFEFPNLFSKLTALENLKFFSKFFDVPVQDPLLMLEMVNLKDDAKTRISDFSKGMKMRLSFIRALMHNPQLIFLDEPTSGLDPVNLHLVKEIILAEKKKGKSIVITTHDMHVADSLCDRVAFIVDGKIVLIDTPRTLKIKYGQHKVRVEYRSNGALKSSKFPLEKIGDNNEFSKLLKEQNIETIHTQEASLEDIFIQTTGRNL